MDDIDPLYRAAEYTYGLEEENKTLRARVRALEAFIEKWRRTIADRMRPSTVEAWVQEFQEDADAALALAGDAGKGTK